MSQEKSAKLDRIVAEARRAADEHQRQLEAAAGAGGSNSLSPGATHSPFAGLKSLLTKK